MNAEVLRSPVKTAPALKNNEFHMDVIALADVGSRVSLKPSTLCNIQVTDVTLGTQVSFTIPKGMSGKAIVDLVEKTNARSPEIRVVWRDCALLKDVGLNDVVSEDTKFTFILCTNSSNLNRSQQENYLAENGLELVPRWLLTVGAALFRDNKGFPTHRTDIGMEQDQGDLFKGNIIRTRPGALKTYAHGLFDEDFFGCDRFGGRAGAKIVIAGFDNKAKGL